MSVILTADEMKKLDAYTIHEIGVPSMVLMERAALAVVDELLQCGEPCSVDAVWQGRDQPGDTSVVHDIGNTVFVCGTGNNGGDGIAAARLLHLKGYKVSVILIGDRNRCTEETGTQLKIAEKYGIFVKERLTVAQIKGELNSAKTVVDALFGIGLSRKLEGIYKAVVDEINASPAKVLAIDVPSGVSADTGEILGAAVKAHKTVVLAYMKAGLTKEPALSLAGRTTVRDIGIYQTVINS